MLLYKEPRWQKERGNVFRFAPQPQLILQVATTEDSWIAFLEKEFHTSNPQQFEGLFRRDPVATLNKLLNRFTHFEQVATQGYSIGPLVPSIAVRQAIRDGRCHELRGFIAPNVSKAPSWQLHLQEVDFNRNIL